MRPVWPIAFVCLLVATNFLPAQERIPLPPPEPPPAGPPAALSPPTAPAPVPPTPLPPSGPPQPLVAPPSSPYMPPPPPPGPYAPYPLYPPPPGGYSAPPPYSPPPLVFRDPAGNPSLWIGFEGLLWWTKNQPTSVPLVTTGPASQGATAGNIGAPGTTSLDGKLNYGAEGGGASSWAAGSTTITRSVLSGSIFDLGQQSAGFSVGDRSGTGNLVINEPVVGAPFVTQVSAPGAETGGVVVGATSRFGGGDVNVLYNLYRANGCTINLLGGYRYLELDETITIAANSNAFYHHHLHRQHGEPPGLRAAGIDDLCDRSVWHPKRVQRRAGRNRVPIPLGPLVRWRGCQAGRG